MKRQIYHFLVTFCTFCSLLVFMILIYLTAANDSLSVKMQILFLHSRFLGEKEVRKIWKQCRHHDVKTFLCIFYFGKV